MKEKREEKLLRREYLCLLEQERKFSRRQMERQEGLLERTLNEKLPPKLQETMEAAFVKAFTLILEKGTGMLEKSCQREKLREGVCARQRGWESEGDVQARKGFSRAAKRAGRRDVLLSGASGIGMGILGIGLPDIPVFTAMLLRSVYETALHYGYGYKGQEERYLVLLVMEGALSYGTHFTQTDQLVNRFLETRCLPEDYTEQAQIQQTAGALSRSLLDWKFLQGLPVVGAAGGAFDAVCLGRVSRYAQLKYRRRQLLELRRKVRLARYSDKSADGERKLKLEIDHQ